MITTLTVKIIKKIIIELWKIYQNHFAVMFVLNISNNKMHYMH